jgi:hypothetical protein
LAGIAAAAFALKVRVAVPAAMVTDAGTVRKALLLMSVTLDPPLGEFWFNVTVHALTPLWPRVVGLQTSVENRTDVGATRLMAAVFELPPSVVVTVTF